MKKVLNVISSVLVAVILVVSVITTVMVLMSLNNDDGIPNLFGYSIMNVESDSMESEEGFYTGDLIVIKTLTKEEACHLKIGDVVTFRRATGAVKTYLETHRIVENVYETSFAHEVKDGIRYHNGEPAYATMGDNTIGADFVSGTGSLDYATPDNIVGIWTGIAIPKLGSAIKFLQSQVGFFCCIVLPLLAFFLYQLIHFIIVINTKKKAEALAAVSASEEEIKQKAVEEFLAKQAAASEAEDTSPPVESEETAQSEENI